MQIIKRSVTQVGKRFMVALDKDWCREHRIKKGDEVDVVVIPEGFCVLPPKTIAENNICPKCRRSYCSCECEGEKW